MSEKVKFVDYQESLAIKVGKFLLSKEFGLASCIGIAIHTLSEDNSLGILYKDPDAKPRKYLFGLVTRESRRAFLGTIWFSNSARNANEQNWVFEAYGRKHIELVRQLIDEMALTFNIKITIRLVQEQPDVERFLSDI